MPETLSPEVERIVLQHVDGQRFTSANDVILVAMRLFNEFQDRYHEELGATIKRGFDQIDRGQGIELKDEAALGKFFDDLKRRGRERYEARRTA